MQPSDRGIGLWGTTFIAVGFTIGAGVFVLTGVVAKIAGAALPAAYALAVLPVFASMLPLAALAAAIPTTGGSYRYPAMLVSPGVAFVGIWVYVLASFFGQIPLYAIGCVRYLRVFAPQLPEQAGAALLLSALFVVNLLGLRLAALVQGLMVVALLAALLAFAGVGLGSLQPALLRGALEVGPGDLALGTALLSFTYLGANGVIELGGEIRHPGRTIPRAFLITFPLVAVVYLLVAVATVGLVPVAALAAADEPLLLAARAALGEGVGFHLFVLGGAVLALGTTLNALFIVGTKSLLMMCRDGLLPARLGVTGARRGTPHLLLTAIWLLSLLGVACGFELKTFATYAALGGLVVLAPLQLAALRLPARFPEEVARAGFKLTGLALWACAGIGLLSVLFFGAVLVVDLGSALKAGLFGLFVLSGVAVYLLRRRQLRRRGVDLRVALSRSPRW